MPIGVSRVGVAAHNWHYFTDERVKLSKMAALVYILISLGDLVFLVKYSYTLPGVREIAMRILS